jgi:hypothetical protein
MRTANPVQPIQVWLPTVHGGLGRPDMRRDAQRAVRAWRGQQLVWVSPELEREVGWREPGGTAMALRGERWELFRVLHVGENGGVWGPTAAAFPSFSVTSLLKTWLNLPVGTIRFVPSQGNFPFEVPVRTEGGITYERRMLQVAPASFLPIAGIDEERQLVHLRWPPDPSSPPTVSPEAESGDLLMSNSSGWGRPRDTGEDSDQPIRHQLQRLAWPAPFCDLFPISFRRSRQSMTSMPVTR